MKEPLLIIEADELLYTKSAGAQTSYYAFFPHDETKEPIVFEKFTRKKDIPAALQEAGYIISDGVVKRQTSVMCEFDKVKDWSVKYLNDLQKKFCTSRFELILSPPGEDNFRYARAKTVGYKSGRKNMQRPHYYAPLKEWLKGEYDVQIATGQEADDLVMIRHHEEPHSIIIAQDKDFWASGRTIYNPVTDTLIEEDAGAVGALVFENKKLKGTGIIWFYAQMLLGDTADSIPGIPGYGPAKTFHALKSCATEQELARAVQQVYVTQLAKEYNSYQEIDARFKEIADLLWIRTKHGEVKSELLEPLLEDYIGLYTTLISEKENE